MPIGVAKKVQGASSPELGSSAAEEVASGRSPSEELGPTLARVGRRVGRASSRKRSRRSTGAIRSARAVGSLLAREGVDVLS